MPTNKCLRRVAAAAFAAVALATFPSFAGAVFRLDSVGTADARMSVPAAKGEAALPERLRGTDFGRALLLAPDYFAGAVMEHKKANLGVSVSEANYSVALSFSDPGYCEQTNQVATTGAWRIITTRRLAMAAKVLDKGGKIAAAKNFEVTLRGEYTPPGTMPVGDDNSCDRMVREVLSNFATWLAGEFGERK